MFIHKDTSIYSRIIAQFEDTHIPRTMFLKHEMSLENSGLETNNDIDTKLGTTDEKPPTRMTNDLQTLALDSLVSPLTVKARGNKRNADDAFLTAESSSPSHSETSASEDNAISAKRLKFDDNDDDDIDGDGGGDGDDNVSYDAFFESMTKSQLKQECARRGLKTAGNKLEVLKRLRSPAAEDYTTRTSKTVLTMPEVHVALKRAGYVNPKDASSCAKRAVQRGLILLDSKGLDTIVANWECTHCYRQVAATLRHCLDQPDYGGLMGNNKGALQCPCGMGRYVTKLCDGSFDVVSSEFHNHCAECTGFGK